MSEFQQASLAHAPEVRAPDGSRVRGLVRTKAASMAHFELPAGACSRAMSHRTVEEIWYVVEGRGELWRSRNGVEEAVTLAPGVCVDIPRGTDFQFRATAAGRLRVVAVTLPPWPAAEEDREARVAHGIWNPNV